METSSTVRISLAQMNVCPGEPAQNLAAVRSWVAEAAAQGSELIVLPELWDTGYALDRAQELGASASEGRFAEIAELARAHRIHVIGSMLELGQPRGTSRPAYNTAMWLAPDGTALGSYRKIHLFRHQPLLEDQHLLPGGVPSCIQSPWGPTGMAICYDLRFPELFRVYAATCGAVMTIVPAQWPLVRIDHWRTLLRARAIENQMIVVGCNRVGESEGQVYGGGSAIYDAWGNAIGEAGPDEELLTLNVDIAQVAEVRSRLPVLEDRRPDLYQTDLV